MRTSSQLRRTDNCEFNPHSNVKGSSPVVRDAMVQKNLVIRALQGEPISDLYTTLANDYELSGRRWDSNVSREADLRTQALRIQRLVDWEKITPGREHKVFRKDMSSEELSRIEVDYFGEPIAPAFDYYVETENTITICKVKTGRAKQTTADTLQSQEAYCLGLAGEKIAPGKEVIVQYLFLADKDSRSEQQSLHQMPNGAWMTPYDSEQFNKIHEAVFNEQMKTKATEAHENLDHSACTPEECASCGHFNMCHYEEPPIPAPPSDSVRPLSDVNLSHDQRQIIAVRSGISRVNAGPGSGKTLVVAARVSDMLSDPQNPVDPEKICILTFTNAGAGEMTARSIAYAAEKGVPIDPEHLTSTTFNSFCQDIIEAHYEELGYTSAPFPITDERKRGIFSRILDQFPHISYWTYGGGVPEYAKKETKNAILRMQYEFADIKKNGYTRHDFPSEWSRMYTESDLDILFLMYKEFNRQLKKQCLLEFDDQLQLVMQLAEQNPNFFNELGYEHIIVDEFQDTDLPQIKLLQKMVDTTQFKSLMCVGDDSQSIFAFRHTSPEYMVNFGTYFGDSFTSYNLIENHRSTRNTIDFANKINDATATHVNKTLIPTKAAGNPVSANGFYSQKQEYEWIADQVKAKWEAGEHDIAIIMSDRFQLGAMADALTKVGVPSTLKSPVRMIDNSRVRAIVSFYDAFMGRGDQGFIDYRNILARGAFRGKTAAQLEEIANEMRSEIVDVEKSLRNFLSFADALDENKIDECYQDFLKNLKNCRSMEELVEEMEDFKTYGKSVTFKREGVYDGVCLTTIHSSKGLEWDITYLCVDKLDDSKYHQRKQRYIESGEYDEQLRKMFVGCTRAREELYVTGQYVLNMDHKNNTCDFNEFLKMAYQMSGRAWGYTYSEYAARKQLERTESVATVRQPETQEVTRIRRRVDAPVQAVQTADQEPALEIS